MLNVGCFESNIFKWCKYSGEWLAVIKKKKNNPIQCYTINRMNSSFMLLLKVWIWGTWTDDLAAKSAGCSSRGPSTTPRTYIGRLTTTYKSSSGASNAIFWPLWYLHTQHILTHMYKQKLSKNKSSKMWSFFKKVSSVI